MKTGAIWSRSGRGSRARVPPTWRNSSINSTKPEVEATFPHEYTDLSFIEASSTSKTLIIKLPPPDLITNAETAVKSGGYQLPDFYGDDMENSALRPTTDKLVFHSKRVGEYTIKFCG